MGGAGAVEMRRMPSIARTSDNQQVGAFRPRARYKRVDRSSVVEGHNESACGVQMQTPQEFELRDVAKIDRLARRPLAGPPKTITGNRPIGRGVAGEPVGGGLTPPPQTPDDHTRPHLPCVPR